MITKEHFLAIDTLWEATSNISCLAKLHNQLKTMTINLELLMRLNSLNRTGVTLLDVPIVVNYLRSVASNLFKLENLTIAHTESHKSMNPQSMTNPGN